VFLSKKNAANRRAAAQATAAANRQAHIAATDCLQLNCSFPDLIRINSVIANQAFLSDSRPAALTQKLIARANRWTFHVGGWRVINDWSSRDISTASAAPLGGAHFRGDLNCRH
jgi:hypothetical protein